MQERILAAKNALENSRRVVVITGAGVSAESGVPTFRGDSGFWKNFDPMKLATMEAFESDPDIVWQWYDARRTQLTQCHPNPAHHALARLEDRMQEFLLITQNVDGLHTAAGSRNIVEIHGSIWRVRCMQDPRHEYEDRSTPLDSLPPSCRSCGGMLRPAVVWFGEYLPESELKRIEDFFSAGAPDFVLVVGTSALFYYIQDWAYSAKRRGGCLVEVNPEPSPISRIADYALEGKAGEILPLLIP